METKVTAWEYFQLGQCAQHDTFSDYDSQSSGKVCDISGCSYSLKKGTTMG